MTSTLEQLRDVSNAHDASRLASMFAEDYQSAQLARSARGRLALRNARRHDPRRP